MQLRPAPFSAPSPARRLLAAAAAAWLLAGSAATARAQAPGSTIAPDFAALSAGVDSLTCGGTPGTVAIFGTGSFPLVMDEDGRRAIVAAGRSSVGGRAVAAAHDSWEPMDGGKARFWQNVAAWAGRKARPLLAFSPGHPAKAEFQRLGFSVKDFNPNTADSDVLKGTDLLFLNMHRGFSEGGRQAVHLFVQQGGGLALTATPWALSAENQRLARDWLDPYGLAYTQDYATCGRLQILPEAPSPYHSALLAVEALLDDHAGRRQLSLEDKRLCAEAILQVLAVRPDLSGLNERLALLSAAFGLIRVGPAQPLDRAAKPVEAMLARYQYNVWQAAPPAQRPAHPSAADWPGLPAAGEVVEGLVKVQADAPADRLVNYGGNGKRVNTGLYALPGRPITVGIPEGAAGKGLSVEIGIHVDANWHHAVWQRFPDVMRRDRLDKARTVTANPFGGLVSIIVPPAAALGEVPVEIDGAVEAPHFVLGRDAAADWARLKQLPGAWGSIESPLMSVYVSRRVLQGLGDAEAVAEHWQRVMETADRYMGYEAGRKRGEAAITDVQISVGYGHAGYPFMMAYGDSPVLVDEVLRRGDWGYYHELGHSYQDDFDGAYTIATHAEVDVNLVPGILMNLIHQRFPNDNDIHGTLDAESRLAARTAFDALPAAEQTWDKACGSAMAYDFYFNLAEAFGWELYGRALGRIFRSIDRPGSDPELAALDSADPNFKRNRFFLAFSLESGHDLGPYFARYGLGKGDFGITASVLAKVKGRPQWTGSRPVTGLSDPGTLTVRENADPTVALTTFSAQDPDPGTIFLYEITAGNEDGAFSLDRVSGQLRAVDLDFERKDRYELTVTVHDNAVPWTAKSVQVTVQVENVLEPKQVESRLYVAARDLAPNSDLGAVAWSKDALDSVAAEPVVTGGDDLSRAFAIEAGRLRLLDPARLPARGIHPLPIGWTGGQGRPGLLWILIGDQPGAWEQRWDGQQAMGEPAYQGRLPAFKAGSVGNDYTRRLSAWLVVPRNGAYRFWIASDDDSVLRVGTDPASASPIAAVSGWTAEEAWDQHKGQASAPQPLRAGQLLYLEAEQHEGGGGDHVAVAWAAGDRPRAVIDGAWLIPADALPAAPPQPTALPSPSATPGGGASATPTTGAPTPSASAPATREPRETGTPGTSTGRVWLPRLER